MKNWPFFIFFGFFVDFKLQDCLPFRSKILNMFSTEAFCFHNWSLLFHFFFLFHDFFIFFFRDSKWTWPESARLKGDWVRSWVWIFDPCYFLLGIILLDVSYMIVFARKSQYHSCNVLKYVFNNNFLYRKVFGDQIHCRRGNIDLFHSASIQYTDSTYFRIA